MSLLDRILGRQALAPVQAPTLPPAAADSAPRAQAQAQAMSLQDFAPIHASATTDSHPNGSLTMTEAMRMGLFGDMSGYAGVPVTDTTATQVETVFACLTKLGGVVSQMPLRLYTEAENGDRLPATTRPAMWWKLNESPADRWTAASWREWIVRCVMLRGDQCTEILRRGPEAVGLRIHHPDHVSWRLVDGRLVYSCIDPETGRVWGVDQDDMLQFSGFGFDGVRSMSAIRHAARNAIGNSLAAARYMGKTIGEGAMPQLALKFPNKLTKEQKNDIRESFVSVYGGGEGRRLPLVLAEGADARELSIDPVDMELLAARKMDKQSICDAIGVPPIILGDSEKASSWGTGIEQITLGWLRFSVMPHAVRWAQEINRKLYRRAGMAYAFDPAALLTGDSKAQADYYRAALGGPSTGDGWVSVNDVLRALGQPTRPEAEYDQPFRAQRGTTTTTTTKPTP
ncbi:MAG: hypothetical protein RIQ53_4162 [Pseudomonadota bacterium]|jgi:HK97 family phage portal protein